MINLRRYISPYNGKRYLLNKNTLEIHDLDKETPFCKIDEIRPEHVYNCGSYEEAKIYAFMVLNTNDENGCHYCLPEKDNG